MENVKEINSETVENAGDEKVLEQKKDRNEQLPEDNQLETQNQIPQESKEVDEKQQKETEPSAAAEQTVLQQEPQTIDYQEDDEEYDDDDDDEEKDTSQKLVIDIPEDEEEEKEDEDDDSDVIALDDLPEELVTKKEIEKASPKPMNVETIITLSDGEEETTNEAASKPGKVQKRRSMGASTPNEEEQFRLKRRKINADGAPKLPQTGYVRYMNDRRESIRKEHPSKTHMEHNKIIGEEWHSLSADVKSSYLKAADVDKQRYLKELHSFLKSRPDILASELAKNKVRKIETSSPSLPAAPVSTTAKPVFKDKPQTNENSKMVKDSSKEKLTKEIVCSSAASHQVTDKSTSNEKNKSKRTPTPPTTSSNFNTNSSNTTSSVAVSASTSTSSIVTPTPNEIPIFTNEFLEHNKIYDMELRSLRKSKTDLELQNSVLEKHVENMKFGVEKMITENDELEEKNRLLEIYLDKLKRKLALALSALPLPSAPHGATMDNIDKYMQDLYKMSTSNSTGPATLNKAKDIIRKLDLQIQL